MHPDIDGDSNLGHIEGGVATASFLYEGDTMRIVLADEISPDSCRLWDVATQDKLDKDRFRRDMGGLVEAYQEVARRLGIMNENEPPRPTGPVLVATGDGRRGKPH